MLFRSLGGVLLDINFDKLKRSFEVLGVQQLELQYSKMNASDLFQQLETGKISESAFYDEIITNLPQAPSKKEIQVAWNSILEEFRIDSLKLLEKLKINHRIFLLSNTNSIHLHAFNKILYQQTGYCQLDNYFEKAYYSHLVGMRKPNADIYHIVINDAKINPEETLFIDDTELNVNAAQKLGFQTHLLLSDEKIEELVYFK